MSRTISKPNALAANRRSPGLIRCAALVIAAGAVFPHSALAATINVPADYPDIQTAINNALVGDVILVDSAASPYTGANNRNLDTLGLAITVKSTGGAAATVIDGGGAAPGFNIHLGETTSTVIDGFTVINCPGYGLTINGADPTLNDCDLSGGGANIIGGKPTLIHCTLDSDATGNGGGLKAVSSDITLSYCSISFISGLVAVDITGGTLTADHCQITDNFDAWGFFGGLGGVRLSTSTADFAFCDISRNANDPDHAKGGGVQMVSSTAKFVSCTINDNSVAADLGYGGGGYGGGVSVDANSSATIILTTIKGNTAHSDYWGTSWGGGVYAAGPVKYTDCTISGNGASIGGGICAVAKQEMNGCQIVSNWTISDVSLGGGVNFTGGATVTDCQIAWNHAYTGPGYGGGAYVSGAKATFERCRFRGNDAEAGFGGGAYCESGSAVFDNCIFSGNAATYGGGGGAMYLESNNQVLNCTVYGNTAATAGAIDASGTPVIHNSILWNNGASPIGGSPAVSFSDVEFGYPGAINLPPQFVSPALLDFRLQQGSPCIDKGSNALVPLGITKDYNLNPRIRKGDLFSFGQAVVDMGATEFRMVINDLPPMKGPFTVSDFSFAGPGPGPVGPIKNNGTFMVIGGFGGDDKGRAFVSAADAEGNWIPQAVLTPPDGHIGDYFGLSVALGNDRLAIGAPRNKQKGNQAGAVYIYRLEGDQWVFDTKITAPDASAGAQFGYSVALEGDLLLAGAWRADPDGIPNAGAVYAFHLDGDQWVHEATLTGSEPEQDSQFGWTIGLSETAAIVGAPFAQQGAGRAFIYRRAGDQWFEEAILSAPEPAAGDQFGFAVGLWGQRAIVGAPWRDVPEQASGGAYLFENSFGQWESVTEFIADTPGATLFGIALAIEGDVVAIGAPGTNQAAGEAEVFSLGETQWEHNATVTAEGGAPGDQFGRWVSLGLDTLAAGAPYYDGPDGPGAVYPFDLYAKPCYADFNADAVLDIFDFLGFVNAFNAGDPNADCTADAYLDLFDFLCFMNAFGQEC